MPIATFLIGLPGSGKTTYRATIDAVAISTDDLIEQWASEHAVTYTEAFQQVHLDMIKQQMMVTLATAITEGKDVVIDRTNMSRKVRAEYLKRLPAHYQRVAVLFVVPRDELDRRLADRAAQTGKYIDASVVDAMIARYEPPSDDEFDVIQHG